MRPITVVIIALIAHAQSITAQAARRPTYPPTKLIAELPGGSAGVEATLNGRRLYYTVSSDTLWCFDVTTKRSTRVATGAIAQLSVSAHGNRVAFQRPLEVGQGDAIWTIP